MRKTTLLLLLMAVCSIAFAQRADVRRTADLRGKHVRRLFGPVLLRERDPMLKSYLLWQKGVNDRILHSLKRARDNSGAVLDKTALILRKDLLIRTALDYFDRV